MSASPPRTRQLHDDVGDHDGRPGREHDDPIGEEDGLGDAVGDQHDRAADPLPEPQDLDVEALPGEGIEGTERLVEQEDRRLEGERSRDREPLTHPAGELARPRSRPVAQADQAQEVPRASLARGRAHAAHLEREGDVGEGRAPRQQAGLLEHEADPGIRSRDRATLDLDGAGCGSQEPRDHPQERALAASVGTDQGDDGSPVDLEVDPPEHVDGAPVDDEGEACADQADRGRGRFGRGRRRVGRGRRRVGDGGWRVGHGLLDQGIERAAGRANSSRSSLHRGEGDARAHAGHENTRKDRQMVASPPLRETRHPCEWLQRSLRSTSRPCERARRLAAPVRPSDCDTSLAEGPTLLAEDPAPLARSPAALRRHRSPFITAPSG